jgi:hypothetical protein
MIYIIGVLLILLLLYMRFVLGASLYLELTHPKIKAIIGFERWPSDDKNQYHTFKLHFIWLALRWDWE